MTVVVTVIVHTATGKPSRAREAAAMLRQTADTFEFLSDELLAVAVGVDHPIIRIQDGGQTLAVVEVRQ